MDVIVIKKRIDYIDFLRGVSMPIWFFISGYFFKENNVKFAVFLKKRSLNLIVPYLFWGMFHYPLWIILLYDDQLNLLVPLKNLFWVNTNLEMPIAGALWFLTALFFSELIMYIVVLRIKNQYCKDAIVVILSLFGCMINSVLNFRLPWALDSSLVGFGFMYLGFIYKQQSERKIMKRIGNLSWIEILIGFIINILMCFVNGYVNMRTGSYGFIPLFWFNAVTSIIIYWNLSKKLCGLLYFKQHPFLTKSVKQVGKYSIIFLCLNQLIILLVDNVLTSLIRIECNKILINCIELIICMIILYIICIAVSKTKLKKLFGMN